MPHVFLSYSRKDTKDMQRLHADLRSAGLDVWVDDTGLEPGTPVWQTEIASALEKAAAVVVVLSPAAKISEWVMRELQYAETFGVRIFPILLRGDERASIPINLINAQWTDARPDYPQALQRMVAALFNHLGLTGDHLPERVTFRGKEYVYIPPGPFSMGSTPDRVSNLNRADGSDAFSSEQPQHQVSLPGFYISRFPVTNADYQVFVQATGHAVPFRDDELSLPYAWDPPARMPPPNKENFPVVLVSWYDAQAYCQWAGGRLPTEAGWEKAARGTQAFEWPWGNIWQTGSANTSESGLRELLPVGGYSPQADSPYGVGDMSGNVWEWCSSLWKPYPYQVNDGREDPVTGGERVLRGGAVGLPGTKARTAYRNRTQPGEYGFTIGFRVAFSELPDDGD